MPSVTLSDNEQQLVVTITVDTILGLGRGTCGATADAILGRYCSGTELQIVAVLDTHPRRRKLDRRAADEVLAALVPGSTEHRPPDGPEFLVHLWAGMPVREIRASLARYGRRPTALPGERATAERMVATLTDVGGDELLTDDLAERMLRRST